ncbi:MAG: methylated-DNA--[protein]-cysteine S-methyltransferase [Saprospiraceae bacterium]|nr:methylated-DNA--[protein]-cysteine S-methyltransferase [Saprospiraceae bacterium]
MLEIFHMDSLIGPLKVTLSEHGLKSISFLFDEECPIDEYISERAMPYKLELDQYFQGERKSFSLPLDLNDLPPFHRDVLKMVSTIPYGKTRSYKQIAQVLGNPKSARAVGKANAKNPIPIVVPCHRVIGNSGELTGYAYGTDIKMKLLELENPQTFVSQIDLFASLV